MRLPLRPAGRQDREGEHHPAEPARLRTAGDGGPAEVHRSAHRGRQALPRDALRARYCTVIFGILTPRDHGFDVSLASGGHPPALVLRADGTAGHLATPGGFLVGALPDARFAAATTALRPVDTLLLHMDGLTEARTGTEGERYGDAHSTPSSSRATRHSERGPESLWQAPPPTSSACCASSVSTGSSPCTPAAGTAWAQGAQPTTL
ncbi:PP2C family protein-serine/threonine phosphatase [Streptomyces sp. NBC_00388]|uniref:PP2C family protein-serine/threonine phosphatase n=1 Tax=Streptomyces sp. NBC_00388 TaxID=2975735 RepID=UPI003FA6E308